MQKNRRKVKENGCTMDLNEDLSNLRLKESTIEDVCWLKSGIVSLKEPQEGGKLLWDLGGYF